MSTHVLVKSYKYNLFGEFIIGKTVKYDPERKIFIFTNKNDDTIAEVPSNDIDNLETMPNDELKNMIPNNDVTELTEVEGVNGGGGGKRRSKRSRKTRRVRKSKRKGARKSRKH